MEIGDSLDATADFAWFAPPGGGNPVACDPVTFISLGGAIYYWDFGDGDTMTTANSQPTHTYTDPGTYAVTLVATNGCGATDTAWYEIDIDGIGVLFTDETEAFCGMDNAMATAEPDGGSPPYAYLWDDPAGQTTATATGLAAGTYMVVITDSSGCSDSGSVTIIAGTPMSLVKASNNPTACGASDGTATVSVTGGAPSYTYLWDDPGSSNTEDLAGLDSGMYVVNITDACGIAITDTAVIDEPAVLTTVMSKTDVNCYGNGDGSATVTAAGGTVPYNYSWNNGQITSTALGLFPGNYTVNVTDINGCLASDIITIVEPAALTASITASTDVSCNGDSTGSASVAPSGGTAPYNYLWDDPNSQTGSTANGLAAGIYVVYVTDSCGSTVSEAVIINEPDALVSNAAVTNVSCNGFSDGAIDLTVSSGSPPYNYLWSTGDTIEDISGLSIGTYSVTVTDSCGTVVTDSIVISEPALLISSISGTDVTCNGAGDGTATVAPSGGTAPYYYSWSNSQSNPAIVGLFPGDYTVNVTDNNTCLTSNIITISEPPALVLSMSKTDATCGNTDGSASLTTSGGTSPYVYLWSTGSSNTSIFALAAGTYSVTVTDTNSCTATDSIEIITVAPQQPICIITVDSSSTRNIVVWEKPVTTGLDSFRIYREIAGLGYSHVGSVDYNSLSEFVDSTNGVNPVLTSYRYKISVVDS